MSENDEMETRVFEVTQAHVDTHVEIMLGDEEYPACWSCPVWQALSPMIRPELGISIGGDVVTVYPRISFPLSNSRCEYVTDDRLADAITAYDALSEFPLGVYEQSLPRSVWAADKVPKVEQIMGLE